jgi:hypothetical protein
MAVRFAQAREVERVGAAAGGGPQLLPEVDRDLAQRDALVEQLLRVASSIRT